MAEVLEKRTRSSKTHSLGGRKFAWDGTIGTLHHPDGQGGWLNVDNIFLPATAPWDWEMLEADYHIRVKEDFTAGQIIEFEVQGETVQFQPMALEWTNDLDQIQQVSMPQNVTPAITNPVVDLLPKVGVPCHLGTITWFDAYGGGIDFEWQCQPTRLAKILRIGSLLDLPDPQQYILDGGNPVLRLNLIFDPPSKQDVDIVVDGNVWNQQSDVQTFEIIEFVKDGEVLWGFMPLRYWDSADNEGQSVATLEKRGNKLYISIRVPYNWLQTAVYPVFIDTDIVPQPAQVGASADDVDGTTVANSTLTTNFVRADTAARKIGLRFQSVSVPNPATISVCYASLWFYSGTYDDPDNDLDFEAADDPDDFVTPPAGRIVFNLITTGNPVRWTASNVGFGGFIDSPSLVDGCQAVVDRPGWAANQDMVIQISEDKGSSSLLIWSWDEAGNVKGAKLHIEYTVGGGVNYPISLSPGLTASATVAYLAAWDRTVAPGLTVSATVAYLVAFKRATTSDLTTAVTVLKGWGRKITTSPGMTVNAVISRKVAYKKATSPGLTVSATILKSRGWKITTSAGLTISATISRVLTYTRAATAGLTVLATIVVSLVAAIHYLITIVTNLTVSASISLTLNRILKIFSTIATALKITSTKTQPLTITSSLASPLAITSTFEVH